MEKLTAQTMNDDGAARLIAQIIRNMKKDFSRVYKQYREIVHNEKQLQFFKEHGKPEHKTIIYVYERAANEIKNCIWFGQLGSWTGEDVLKQWEYEIDNGLYKGGFEDC